MTGEMGEERSDNEEGVIRRDEGGRRRREGGIPERLLGVQAAVEEEGGG